MRREISLRLKTRGIKKRVILVLLFFFFFITVNGFFIYTVNPSNSYFNIIKKIIPYPAIIIGRDIVTMARYEDEIILNKRLYEEVYKINFEEEGEGDKIKDIKKIVKDEFINAYIMNRVLDTIGVEVSKKEINEEYEKIINDLGGREEMKDILQFTAGWRESDLKKKIYLSILEEKIKESIIYQVKIDVISIIPDSIGNEGEWVIAEEEARVIYNKILEGEITFSGAKNQFGSDNFLLVNNDEKYYYLDEFPDNLKDIVLSLEVGEVSEPVETDSGYHILKLEEERGYYRGELEDFLMEQRAKFRIWTFAPGEY